MFLEALDNKCPACGAQIDFNPKTQSFDCHYCASKFTLEEMKKFTNASSDKNNTVDSNALEKETTLEGFTSFRCRNCGAEIMADDTVTATRCVYCGSSAILKEKIDSGRAPDLIIPFKKVKEDAVKAFTQLTKGKPLMPSEFKEVRNIEKISGVYIPFWAYDIDGKGNITFSCIDTHSWSDSRYHYTKTDTYECVTSADLEFNKVLADASSRFKDELMDSIEPFNYNELVPYNHAYLAGFLAEKYDVDEDKAYNRATERTMNSCIEESEHVCHHQSRVIKSNNMFLNKKHTHYIMLPVWMVNIKYNEKIYTFAMNGQTGKLVGDIPISAGKMVFYTLLIFTICMVLGITLALM